MEILVTLLLKGLIQTFTSGFIIHFVYAFSIVTSLEMSEHNVIHIVKVPISSSHNLIMHL